MKVTFSNLRDRWCIACTGGVYAYVDEADCVNDAHATVLRLVASLKAHNSQPIDALMAGEVAGVIAGNVVLIPRKTLDT